MKTIHKAILIAGIPVTIVVFYSVFIMANILNEIESSKQCYGSECKNPYLENEILSIDRSGKTFVLGLRNGTFYDTGCSSDEFPFSNDAVSYSCSDGVRHYLLDAIPIIQEVGQD